MSTAINRADSMRTRVLKYKHSGATVKDTIYLLGGRVLVAVSDALANVENIFIHASERIEMPKQAALAVTAGATLYWDNTNNVVTTTSTSNTKCGIAVQDALAADSTVVMELTNAVNY